MNGERIGLLSLLLAWSCHPVARLLLIAALTTTGNLLQARQQPPLRAGVELVLVDVQVVDRRGQPIAGLGPDDFRVQIDRRPRKIVSLEAIRFEGSTPHAAAQAPTRERIEEGRTLVLALDESRFAPGHAMAAREAARRFISRLHPQDRIGLYKYPIHGPELVLSTDHQQVLDQLDTVMGVLDLPSGAFRLSFSEIIDLTAGDQDVLTQVSRRECPQAPGPCRKRIEIDAQSLAGAFEMQVAQSVQGLRALLGALATYQGRKTLVLVSGGLLASDRSGARPDVRSLIDDIGREAALANVNLYVLHMDNSFFDAFSAKGAAPRASFMRDSGALGSGLERFAGVAGGELFRVQAGTGDTAFDRVLLETSAYYLLGVEPEPSDRDGRPHPISVSVRTRGAQVRSRNTLVIPVR